MTNQIQKNNEKNIKNQRRSRIIKTGSLLLISLFVVLCTILPSFGATGEYELEGVSRIVIADSSYVALGTFMPPFELDDHPYSTGDYLFTFSDSYLIDYPDGAVLVYSEDASVLEAIQNANSGDGSIFDGYFALSFDYLAGIPQITIPGSLIVKPTILDNIFSIFSGIGSWIASIFTSLIGVFWLNGSFTPLGVLSLVSLAFGVGFLLIAVISRFLRFRG